MSDFTDRAQVVVIGAGIVGNSIVGHLADHGWRDLVLVDKGPLPDPGGSTGHASNFIFPVDHGKELAHAHARLAAPVRGDGRQHHCGGIEVARTDERMEELRRRMASAKAWGIDASCSPRRIGELVPFVDTSILLGGFHTPSVSVVDSLQAGTLMRQRAVDAGALTVSPTPRCSTRGRPRPCPPWSAPTAGPIDASTSSSPAACGAPHRSAWPARASR
jgi:glycine/D-amino acid oxidase-like deaminating enzyme